MKFFTLLLFGILVVSCSKSDPPKPPGVTSLVFPEQNSICTTGVSLTPTSSRVTFNWLSATNTESYELSVTNLNTNSTQRINTTELSADVVLEKGAPHSWEVTSGNNQVSETTPSANWLFYNAGSQISHPPFPTQIVLPKSGATVFRSSDNTILLEWQGFDVDGDILEYEVYADQQASANVLITTTNESTNSFKLPVEANVIYYWKVVCKDEEGNVSTSNIYSFKVL
ncbi:hypothetical protein [Eudoraea sp.]|uniref:hypothetical protein n=1 Tax=Eudoraea sp. TaxID=1979955 RepID=UPI003C787F60